MRVTSAIGNSATLTRAEPILVALDQDDLAVLGAQLILMRPPPMRHADEWNRPEIGLHRPLEV